MRVRELHTADLYATLGIATDASDDEIARAYRMLAKQLHPDSPDAVANSEAHERFRAVAAAYEVLGDPRRRREYDLARVGLVVETIRVAPAAARPAPAATVRWHPAVRWTRRKATAAFVGGVLVTVLGLAISAGVLAMMRVESVARSDDVEVHATRVDRNGDRLVRFTTLGGEVVEVPEPEQVNPGRRDERVTVSYDPDDPTDVRVSESTLARDLTFLIVGLKLLVAGPVFAVIGWRRRATAVR